MSCSGSCICGAVKFTLRDKPKNTGACHCGMCRKWSGGVYLGVEVAPDAISFEGEENLTIYTSSPWAERGFCKTCGSSIFYRVTAEGPHKGMYHIGLGTLNDADGIALTQEIFIDRKPDGYAFAGKQDTMTEAEVMAMFGGG